MTLYVIGDTHFHHKNILKFEPELRPFDTVEEMNEEMIRRWNDVVNENDTVYHLGDVAFGNKKKLREIVRRLNGHKVLFLGNHDISSTVDLCEFFDDVYGGQFFRVQGKKVLLTHFPVHPNQMEHRCVLNVHGHLHSKLIMDNGQPDMRYFNVSAEHINLTPIPWSEIEKRVEKL